MRPNRCLPALSNWTRPLRKLMPCGHTLVGKYWYDDNPETLRVAKEFAQKAVSLDPSDALGHSAIGHGVAPHASTRRSWKSLRSCPRSQPDGCHGSGRLCKLAELGWKAAGGTTGLRNGCLARSFAANLAWEIKGTALFLLKRYPEAISSFQRAGSEHYFIHAFLAAAYALDGQLDFAHSEVAKRSKSVPILRLLG